MTNVLSFIGGLSSYRPASSVLLENATLVASWSDGQPLVATRTIDGVRRVDLGFFPASNDTFPNRWHATTDGDLLRGNALLYVAGRL